MKYLVRDIVLEMTTFPLGAAWYFQPAGATGGCHNRGDLEEV